MSEQGERTRELRLLGVIVAGVGDGARFIAIDWVRAAIRETAGFDPYPGTLNVALADDASLARWREVLQRAAIRVTPPEPGACGGWLVPVVVEDAVPAAVIVPDITRHPDKLLEVVAPIHLRTHLRRGDGQPVLVVWAPGHEQIA